MKRILYILSFVLVLVSFVSCQDDVNILLTSQEEQAQTRSQTETELLDYYWSGGKKYYLQRIEEETFILFSAKDRKTILERLQDYKVLINECDINELRYEGSDMTGRNSNDFQDFEWAKVELDIKTAESIEGIIYAAPYYSCDGSDTFPLTNFIYVFLKSDDITNLSNQAEKYNLGLIGKLNGTSTGLYLISCTKESAGNALKMANTLYDTGLFDGVEPIFLSAKPQSDPLYNTQWYLKQNTSYYGYSYDIKYENALNVMPGSNNNILVGVLDNGVDLSHPDLLLNSFSWDAVTSSSPSVKYTYTGDNAYINSHGTNVAGIISAIPNNNIGIAGIASRSGISVMSFSIDYTNVNFAYHVNLAVQKAVEKGVAVLNCSWSYPTVSQVIEGAIEYAVTNGRYGRGMVMVFCTGNYNDNNTNHPLLYPANHSPASDVISVGGMNYTGYRYSVSGLVQIGSCYGSGLDLTAPGHNIQTTKNMANPSDTNAYEMVTGTSFATPQVSAIAAQILAKSPYLSNKDVEYVLCKTANQSIPGFTSTSIKQYGIWSNEVGYGLLNAYAALSMAGNTNSNGSLNITGTTTLSANGNGFASTTLTAVPTDQNYTYIWSGIFYGYCDSWYIWPSGGYSTGPNADVNIYLSPGQIGGTLLVTCRAYNGTTFIGQATAYVTVSP